MRNTLLFCGSFRRLAHGREQVVIDQLGRVDQRIYMGALKGVGGIDAGTHQAVHQIVPCPQGALASGVKGKISSLYPS